MHTVSEFYDTLAIDYDAMTEFEKRFVKERPFYHLLVERYGIRNALDAGSGTGFHSLLLARLGVEVTAVDLSSEMLGRLARHSNELGLNIETVQSSFVALDEIVAKRFDTVVCLGNTLAHLTSDEELQQSLKNFWLLLKPHGHLIVQTLNYDRILSQRNRVQSIKENGGKTFVRFYDFNGSEKIMFNVLTLEKTDGIVRHSLITTQLRAVRKDALIESALTESGFDDAEVYGSIRLDKFDPESSQDLVIIARKNI